MKAKPQYAVPNIVNGAVIPLILSLPVLKHVGRALVEVFVITDIAELRSWVFVSKPFLNGN